MYLLQLRNVVGMGSPPTDKDVTMDVSFSNHRSFVLKVERGRTAFPERAVQSERFLIGAGNNCHLQLGGNIPIVHSIVLQQDGELWIDSLVATPPLVVNGQTVRESFLHEGDVIEIGDFVFTVGKKDLKMSNSALQDESPQSLSELSAEELVGRLESELETLERISSRREQGATALLQAARTAGQESDEHQIAFTPSVHQLLQQLQLRANQLDRREELLNSHAERLERTQRELQQQIKLLEAELAQGEERDESPELRLTA